MLISRKNLIGWAKGIGTVLVFSVLMIAAVAFIGWAAPIILGIITTYPRTTGTLFALFVLFVAGWCTAVEKNWIQ